MGLLPTIMSTAGNSCNFRWWRSHEQTPLTLLETRPNPRQLRAVLSKPNAPAFFHWATPAQPPSPGRPLKPPSREPSPVTLFHSPSLFHLRFYFTLYLHMCSFARFVMTSLGWKLHQGWNDAYSVQRPRHRRAWFSERMNEWPIPGRQRSVAIINPSNSKRFVFPLCHVEWRWFLLHTTCSFFYHLPLIYLLNRKGIYITLWSWPLERLPFPRIFVFLMVAFAEKK